MKLSEALDQFDPEPGWLNTASFGVPPRATIDALTAVLEEWRRGVGSWETWTAATDRSREVFARLVNADSSDVSVGAQVSQLLAPVAAGIPDGSVVVVPEEEFTSNVFPWAAQAGRGVTVRTAPAADLASAVTDDVDVVAFSIVQSMTGAVADVDAITAAAASADAITVADGTQAVGWLPVDASKVDALAVGAYKWLLAPRGSGFLVLRPTLRDRLIPHAAGWYAGADVHDSYYGMPLRLATDARRFDTSPAWFTWVGTTPSLELIEAVGVDAIHEHDVALANRFRDGLGLPPGDSAIVSVDVPGAQERLDAAGVRAAVRGGSVRVSFHLYTTTADVDRAVGALSRS